MLSHLHMGMGVLCKVLEQKVLGGGGGCNTEMECVTSFASLCFLQCCKMIVFKAHWGAAQFLFFVYSLLVVASDH